MIEASFHGTRGGAALRNVDGSFHDFVVDHHEGTRRRRLAAPPDAWGGRAAVAWARRLAGAPGYDPEVERAVEVARALDAIYGRAGGGVRSVTSPAPGARRSSRPARGGWRRAAGRATGACFNQAPSRSTVELEGRPRGAPAARRRAEDAP